MAYRMRVFGTKYTFADKSMVSVLDVENVKVQYMTVMGNVNKHLCALSTVRTVRLVTCGRGVLAFA